MSEPAPPEPAPTCAVCEGLGCSPWQFYACGHRAHVRCDPEYADQGRCPECARTVAPPPGAAPGGVQRCADCRASLGILTQQTLRGIVVPAYCLPCQGKRRARLILDGLPEERDRTWTLLGVWEQEFVVSVRDQFARKGQLSDKQMEVLERIWKKV